MAKNSTMQVEGGFKRISVGNTTYYMLKQLSQGKGLTMARYLYELLSREMGDTQSSLPEQALTPYESIKQTVMACAGQLDARLSEIGARLDAREQSAQQFGDRLAQGYLRAVERVGGREIRLKVESELTRDGGFTTGLLLGGTEPA